MTNEVGPKGDKGPAGIPDKEAEATARRAGEAFVDAIEGDPPEEVAWYDAPWFRNIKLGTIATMLLSAGALLRGCVDTAAPVDNPVIEDSDVEPPATDTPATPENPVEPPDYSKFDQWHRTTVKDTSQLPPVFWQGLPQAKENEHRDWKREQGYWHFIRKIEVPEVKEDDVPTGGEEAP